MGVQPNSKQQRLPDEQVLTGLAVLTRKLQRIPSDADLLYEHKNDPTVPSQAAVRTRAKTPESQIKVLAEFCSTRPEFADVAQLLDVLSQNCTPDQPASTAGSALIRQTVQVPQDYIALVRDFRGRGEEEKRQLVAQFFFHVLGYKRSRVHSEHKHNDVRVHNRRDQPWLVVEVKPLLETARDKQRAVRQAFDYAHRHGMRFVVISDADFYEIYDRCAGQRLSYDEMRQGSFHLSALRRRDSDLVSLLAAER
jgi:hypothetical protein